MKRAFLTEGPFVFWFVVWASQKGRRSLGKISQIAAKLNCRLSMSSTPHHIDEEADDSQHQEHDKQ